MDLILRFLWRGKLLSKARWRMAQEDMPQLLIPCKTAVLSAVQGLIILLR